MSAKILAPLALVIGALALLIPHFQHMNKLFNFTTDLSSYRPRIQSLLPTCTYQHPTTLVGCEDFQLLPSLNTIFAACLDPSSSLPNRLKWGRSRTIPTSHIPGDLLYRWDLTSNTALPLTLTNFPTLHPSNTSASDASFLGMDAHQLPNGTVAIWVINFLPSQGPAVEKFLHEPGTDSATHVARFLLGEHAPAPNDVYAVPDRDAENAFYVTNDHGHPQAGLVRDLEYVALRPWSWVVYHSDSSGWRRALDGLVGTNGIAADKTPGGTGYIFISELMLGVVRVVREKAPGVLEEVQSVDMGIPGDNPSFYNGELWIPAGAKSHLLTKWMEEDPKERVSKGPGSVVKRVNVRELGEGFYGKGFTASPKVETVYLDAEGVLANASSTVAFVPYDVEAKAEKGEEEDDDEDEELEVEEKGRKGDLYVTGLLSPGILKCTNFE